ncbi:MAG: peptidoglycan-binding protein [Mangrovibacterium sp.]
MKQKKTILILLGLLALAGGITYGIIRFTRKKEEETAAGTGTTTGTGSGTGSNTVTASTGSGYSLPAIQSYTWWENKLGRAGFPLKYGSKGVEVVKLQEELNLMGDAKPALGLSPIAVDGIWGPETDTRFKQFFPGQTQVSEYLFRQEFDQMMEILK